MSRQPQRQFGPEDHHRQYHEHDEMERDRAEHDVLQLAVPDALDHEQIDADRRRDLSKLDEQHQHDAEHDRVDAIAVQHRKDQRHRDHDHAEAFDQAAEDREQNEERAEEFQPAELQPDDELRHLLADPRKADRIGEDVGGQDNQQDVAGEFNGVMHRLDEHARRQIAEHRAEHDREQAPDGGALGGGDEPGINAAERAGDQDRERQHVGERAEEFRDRLRTALPRGDAGL